MKSIFLTAFCFIAVNTVFAEDPLTPLSPPFNPTPDPGKVTKIRVRQATPPALPANPADPEPPQGQPVNSWKDALDYKTSFEFPPDRTGLIRIETEITHTYPGAVDTSLVDADGVLIDSKEDTNNPGYIFPPARYTSPFFIRIHNPYGHPAVMIPFTTGRSGHKDGADFQRETPSETMDSSGESEQTGDSDEGEYGEESSSGGCGGCKSCDLSHSQGNDDVTTDHPNGVDGPGAGDGAATGQIPAGTSANGDSKTNINFDIDFGSGVNLGDFKLHSLGDATVTRNSSQELTTIVTDSSHTSLETLSGGSIRIRHSSDPDSPATTVFREITFENTAPREIKKTSVLYPGAANSKTLVTIWRHNPTTKTWECVIANGMRKKKLTLETDTPELKVERHQIFERAAGATGEANILISDFRKTYVKNQHGWKKTKLEILGESGSVPLVTTWTYYDSTESNYAAGLLKTVTRPTGQVETHQYSQPGPVHRHEISRLFANAAPTIETRNIALGANSREITQKVSGSGEVFSKMTQEWTTSSTITETSFHSSTGINTVKSSAIIPFGNDLGSKMISSSTSSDMGGGNVITTGMSQQILRSGGDKTIIQASGQVASNVVIDGQSQQKIVNRDGIVLRSQSTVIQPAGGSSANGAISGDALYSDFDTIGRPRRVDYFPTGGPGSGVYHELRTYGCCGADTRTDRYGVTSYIEYDDLGRAIKTNRLGVTQATVYDGLSVHSHRYPGIVTGTSWSSAPSAGNQLGSSTTNLQGTVTSQTYRSPQTGDLVTTPNTTTRYFLNPAGTSTLPGGTPSDVGMRTVQVLTPVADDDSVPASQTTDYYRDGKVKETFGNLSPRRRHQYERNATGLKVTESYSDGTNLFESVITQYDYAGRTLTVQQGSGTTTYHYTQDKLTRVTDPDGVDTFYFYNARGEQDKTILDLDGNNIANESIDQVTRTISQPMMATPPGSSTAIAVNGSINQVIVSGTTYTTAGESYSTFDGLKSWSYTPGTTPPTINETDLAGSGNWTETTTLPDNTQQVQTYTAGKLTTSSKLLTDHSTILTSTSYAYDSLNRTEEITDSRTGTSVTEYISDTVDAVKSVTDAATNKTEFTYDHRGRRTHVDQPDTDGHDNITITKYQPNGKTKEVTGDQTYRSTYTYDYAYRMKTLTTFGTTTATTTWNYDETRGWLLNKRDAAIKGYDYQYTAAGRLFTVEAARFLTGSTTTRLKKTHTYDAAGRLSTITYNDGTTPAVSITHDRLSRPDVQSNGIASTDYDYDPTSFILDKETITYNIPGQPSFTRIIDHKQDALQRNEGYTLQTPGTTPTIEQNVTYRYSATNGRLGAVSAQTIGSTDTQDFIYGYETNSNLLKTIQSYTNYNFSTNTGTGIHQVTNSFESNRNDLLTKANTRASDDSVISNIGYTVNSIGQRSNATRSGAATNSTAWTYDALGQLVTADDSNNDFDRAYQYDGIGNREKSADSLTLPGTNNYSVNALNQYIAVNTFSPTHDEDGNQLDAQIKPLASSSLVSCVFQWDAENRLTEVKNASNTTLVKHYYDAQYRRIASTVAGVTSFYIYQGWNVTAEYTGSTPALSKTNLWGMDLSGSLQGAGGVGGLLAVTEIPVSSAPVTYYPLYDGNGNITEYIDGSATVVAHYVYDPFGNTTVATEDKADDFSYRFSTKPIDQATGLYYYGYRYYAPNLGRWISRDPIEERGGLNVYGFVGNDGVNKMDVFGLEPNEELEPDPNLPRGMTPIGKNGIPKIEKCNIYIFLTHRYDVEMGGLVEAVFNKIDKVELMATDDNPCARVSFLSCFTNLSNRDVKTFLDRSRQNSIVNIFLPLQVKNQMLTVHADPDFPGDTGKAMLQKAREEATTEASKLCKCKCSCKSVNIHIYVYGLHWVRKQSLAPDKAAPILAIHMGAERWKKYFETINVPCEKESGSSNGY